MRKPKRRYFSGVSLIILLSVISVAQAAVYVSNVDSANVTVIDPETDTVITNINVGSEPRNIANKPGRSNIYVPNRFSDSVSVISAVGNTVVATVTDASFDEPYAVAVTYDGKKALAANKRGGGSSTGSVTIIDTASNTVSGVITDACFSSPEAIATNPVLPRAYVVNRGNGTVCIINTDTNSVIGSVSVGGQPRYAVVTPSGAYLYVSRNASGDISKINIATNATTSIAVSGTPRNMDVSDSGDKVYAALQSSSIAVIDTATDAVNTISFSGAFSTYGVAIMPGTNKGYVTDEDRDTVHVFDVTTETEITGPGLPIAVSPTGRTPRAIVAINVVPTSAVPMLSSVSLIALVLIIMLAGLLYRRRFIT